MPDSAATSTSDTTQTTTAASTPPATSQTPAASAPTGGVEIPAEFADKPWAADLKGKTVKDVFAKLAAAELLVGRKGAILPADNASPEAWGEFFTGTIKPKEKSAYVFSPIPEQAKEKPNLEIQEIMRGVYHGADLHPLQAMKVQQGIDRLWLDMGKKQKEALDKADSDFEALSTEVFGNDKDAVLSKTQKYLSDSVPTVLKDKVLKLPVEALAVIAATIDSVTKKHINSAGIHPFLGGYSASSNNSADGLRAERMTILQNPKYKDTFSPEGKALQQRVAEINERMAKLVA